MLDFIRARFSGSVTWLVGAVLVAIGMIVGGAMVAGAIGEAACVAGDAAERAACETAGMALALGGGLIWKGITVLFAFIVMMACLRLWLWIRALSIFQSETLNSIKQDSKAAAIFLGLVLLSIAVLGAPVWGQPPSPAAWPDPAAPVAMESVSPEFRAPDAWPAHYAACEPYRADIESAVRTYWPDWPYPAAWAAQLYQESLCDSGAVSPVGARGMAQFMPATWREAQAHFGIRASPHDDVAIERGAWYMARMMAVWRSPRPQIRRWELALASYNAGAGNIIRAQGECDGARDWDDILPCLPDVTGHHARETTQYVVRIRHHWQAMAGGNPLALPPELRS